nr:MAG TPA: hypothetical protein [Caudoviricetes sp.]
MRARASAGGIVALPPRGIVSKTPTQRPSPHIVRLASPRVGGRNRSVTPPGYCF